MTNFDELCRTLEIVARPSSEENLDKLIHWCKTNISTDSHYAGDLNARFGFYQKLTSKFLEKLQPNLQRDRLTTPLQALNNMTPLRWMVDLGFDVCLKALAPTREQINTRVDGLTLLQLAAIRGHLHTLEALLTLGADPKEPITKGLPILISTLMLPISHDEQMVSNKEGIYRILSQYTDDINIIRNESEDNILHIMATFGYTTLVQETLGRSIALVSTPNNFMHYPVHAAILNAQRDCAKCLIAVEGIEKLTDAKERNALHYAARYGDREMVEICIQSPIAIDSVDNRHQTPLILASRAQNIDAVIALVASGANVNARDDRQRTALHYAVEANDVNSVNVLLSCKAIEVNASDDDGQTPLDLIQANTGDGDEINVLLMKKEAAHGTRPVRSV